MKLKMVTQKRAEYFHNLRPVKLGLETAFGEIKMDSFLIIFSISIYLTKGGVFQYMGISIRNKQLLLQHLSFLSNLFYDCVCTCVSHSVHLEVKSSLLLPSGCESQNVGLGLSGKHLHILSRVVTVPVPTISCLVSQT